MTGSEPDFDLFIIGGGVNGCGVARDAAGRGLKICLAEMNDLAWAASSASTKLFHGGLRYLEYFEFGLVSKALREREILLRAMPHISWPLRFVLPYHPAMRFESRTPAARLLSFLAPWMKGRRPAWIIRLGLFIYDHLGGRRMLPGTSKLDLSRTPEGEALHGKFKQAFEYSDCWVDDARLVVLNARDAARRGAEIHTRTKALKARPSGGGWRIETENLFTGARRTHTARVLINAGGPWAAQLLRGAAGADPGAELRLVRGSHIVTRRLYDHEKCYFFQGEDGRIVFAIPYETDFTLIGTTEADHPDLEEKPLCTENERDYLLTFVNRYFKKRLSAEDVVWSYSGLRPLHAGAGSDASAASRGYTLKIETPEGAPLLSIFGGKITTYRMLAEDALEKIAAWTPGASGPWTAEAPLPGGNFPADGFSRLVSGLREQFPFLDEAWARRLARAYGTEAAEVLGGAERAAALGRDFGASLTGREVEWMMEREFARTAEDIVFRRSKLGLRMSRTQIGALDAFVSERRASLNLDQTPPEAA